jgi:flagellar protein FliS
MNPQAAQSYLRTKVLTATPEQLQLMLFDGAIRFAEQARMALEKKNFEQSYNLLMRAQKIVQELQGALKPEVAPELCNNLAALYSFVYRRLVDANLHQNISSLDEALGILKHQRETWIMLLDKLGKQKASQAAQSFDAPAPDPRMEASISMRG